jgi:hypothetical protein
MTQPLWGLIALAGALIVLAHLLGAIPPTVGDLIVRALPALLIFAGISFLLRDRVRFSGLLALIVSAALVGVVAWAAFSTRAGQQREDFRQPLSQAIAPEVSLLRVRVATLATEVEFQSGALGAGVTGEFVGSTDNRIDAAYEQLADNSATLTLREEQVNAVPRLDTIGRGTLRVSLPAGVPLDVEFVGGDGALILNMSNTMLERLNITVTSGDVVITLPEYAPLFSQPDDLLGTLTVRDGNLAMFIPRTVAARLELDRGGSGIEPEFDDDVYNYLRDDVLEARSIDSADMVARYALTVPRGLIRVEAPA